MTFSTFYNVGTVSVENGSSAVTGVDTFWTGNVKGGDYLWVEGLVCRIASIADNSTLTLARPWPGADATNVYYEAMEVLEVVGYQRRTRELLERLSSGNLSAFAALEGGDKMLPIFTGAGVLGLLDGSILKNIAEIPVEVGKLLIGNDKGQYEPIDKDDIGIQDPNENLADLAELELDGHQILQTNAERKLTPLQLAARQILQTDEDGVLKAIALLANKFLRTDANGDLTQSDITAAAIAMLALAGTENKFPFFTGESGAALADLTPFARAILGDANAIAVLSTLGIEFATQGDYWRISFNAFGLVAQGNSSANGEDIYIPFPIAYTQVYGAWANFINVPGGALEMSSLQMSTLDQNGMTWRKRYSYGGAVGQGANSFRWWAIGKIS